MPSADRMTMSMLSRASASKPPESPAPVWFALRVRSNHERVVGEALRGKGHEEFVPLYRKEVRWSDRKKLRECPLFPGYVFSRFDIKDRLSVLTIPGVLHVVGAARPEPVEEEELIAVKRVIASGFPVGPWPFLRPGQAVMVECGSLAGVRGVLVEIKNQCRLVVSLTLLQRSVGVEMDRDCVRPVNV
jgi:transcription antitermination factor NusG